MSEKKLSGKRAATGVIVREDSDMPYEPKDEAENVLAGYVSTHSELDGSLSDAEVWRRSALMELEARRLGVVKSFSNETLEAIARGDLDMLSIYATARLKHGVADVA